MPRVGEGGYEKIREKWNSRRPGGKGDFRGKVLVILDGKEVLVEMEGWRIVRLAPPSGEEVEVVFSGPSSLLRRIRGEGELVWMVINREVRVRGKFRPLSKNLPLWAKLLPFLASNLGG